MPDTRKQTRNGQEARLTARVVKRVWQPWLAKGLMKIYTKFEACQGVLEKQPLSVAD